MKWFRKWRNNIITRLYAHYVFIPELKAALGDMAGEAELVVEFTPDPEFEDYIESREATKH